MAASNEAQALGYIEERLTQIKDNIYDLTIAVDNANQIADRAQKVAEYIALREDKQHFDGRVQQAKVDRGVALRKELWPAEDLA